MVRYNTTMVSLMVLGTSMLVGNVNANTSETYQLSGEIIIDEQTVAKPRDQIQLGAESYIIVQSDEHVIRLTYHVQNAGDNLLNARFVIELDSDEGWDLIMQPSVQAVVGQASSVTYEASPDSDEQNVTFNFTFSSVNDNQ